MDVIDPLNGLASVVFTFPMGLVDGVYPETETYIDNYSIDIVKELPQITGRNADTQRRGNQRKH